MTDLILSQIADPFRIILLIGLFATMWRTRAGTGVWLPLALGSVFVAVLIPSTVAPAAEGQMAMAIGTGIVANAAWLAVIAAGWAVWREVTAGR